MYIYGCHDISRAGDGNRGLGMSDWFWQSFFIFGGDELGRSSSSVHITFAMHSRWFSTPLKTNGWNPKIGALGRCFEPFPALREFSRSISRCLIDGWWIVIASMGMKPPKSWLIGERGLKLKNGKECILHHESHSDFFLFWGGRRGELYLKKMLIYDESLIGCHGFHLPQTWISMNLCVSFPLPFFSYHLLINVSSFLHDPTQQQELLDIRSREISDPWTLRFLFFFFGPGETTVDTWDDWNEFENICVPEI